MERHAAGHQDLRARCRAQQWLHDDRAGIDDLLEVIEHEQQLLVPKVILERLKQRAIGRDSQPKSVGDLLSQRFGVGQGRQIDEPHTIGEAWKDCRRDLEAQSRLARAPRPGQGQQAVRRHQITISESRRHDR